MDFRQLKYVIAVAEELSFTRAAARLNITQPPLTQTIRQLEDELGFPLFYRTKRSVQLTSAGEIVLVQGKRLMAGLDSMTRAARRASRGETGRIAIGFVGSVAFHYLPRVLREFRTVVPAADIELVELKNAALFAALKEGRIDVVFMRPYFQDPEIILEEVLEERFWVALPSTHVLAHRKTLSLRAIKNEPFVTSNLRPAPSMFALVMSICERAGFHPQVVQVATDIQSVIGLVAAGIGVSIVPDSLTQLSLSGVNYVQLSEVRERARLVMAWRKRNRNEVLPAFLDVARRQAHEA